MATFVTLTDYWSVHRGRGRPCRVTVNLDLVKTIRRQPAGPEAYGSPKGEHTEIWFGRYGDDAERVLVTETPAQILAQAGLGQVPIGEVIG
jgi:hypothetical protein